jgi:hypothetical protein
MVDDRAIELTRAAAQQGFVFMWRKEIGAAVAGCYYGCYAFCCCRVYSLSVMALHMLF